MTKEQAIERCHQLLETKHSNWLGLSNQQAIAILIDILKEKDTEIEKKDKQIDLMAEEIEKRDIEFTEYCEFKIVCDRNCKHCIEQYFKNKAINNGK